jgi:hypothetical protein
MFAAIGLRGVGRGGAVKAEHPSQSSRRPLAEPLASKHIEPAVNRAGTGNVRS